MRRLDLCKQKPAVIRMLRMSSVADLGCIFIPDPNFFHPLSRDKRFSDLGSGSAFRIPIKEFKYFNFLKLFLTLGNMIRDVHPESGS